MNSMKGFYIDQLLRRSRDTWRSKRPDDGDDIYDAMNPTIQGKHSQMDDKKQKQIIRHLRRINALNDIDAWVMDGDDRADIVAAWNRGTAQRKTGRSTMAAHSVQTFTR